MNANNTKDFKGHLGWRGCAIKVSKIGTKISPRLNCIGDPFARVRRHFFRAH